MNELKHLIAYRTSNQTPTSTPHPQKKPQKAMLPHQKSIFLLRKKYLKGF